MTKKLFQPKTFYQADHFRPWSCQFFFSLGFFILQFPPKNLLLISLKNLTEISKYKPTPPYWLLFIAFLGYYFERNRKTGKKPIMSHFFGPHFCKCTDFIPSPPTCLRILEDYIPVVNPWGMYHLPDHLAYSIWSHA